MHIDKFAGGKKQGKPKPIYVVYGPDQFLVQRARDTIRQRVLGDADSQMAEVEFDGRESALGDVLLELQTLPLLSPRRLVWVRSAGVFLQGSRKGLLKYLDSPCATGVLVLLLDNFKTDTAFGKKVGKVGVAVECSPPYEDQMPGRLTARAKAHYKKTLSHGAAELLAEHVGNDLAAADEELKKLALYVGERGTIDERDVDALVTHTRREKVFALGDAIADGDAAEALKILSEFLAEGVAIPMIVGSMRSQLSRLMKAKAMAERMSLGDVAGRFPMPYRFRERFMRQVRTSTLDGLAYAYSQLAEADFASKTSGGSDRGILVQLVLNICRQRRRQPAGT